MSTPRFYTDDELKAMDRPTLEIIAEARGIEIDEGSGVDGAIRKDDLIDALSEDQIGLGIHPAILPPPAEETAKRYRVGPREWDGHAPGATISAVIPAVREQMLLEGGALSLVTDTADSKETPQHG